MTVKTILDAKGRDVVTVEPTMTLAQAARLLSERRIGAVVVTKEGSKIAGILSERDIVRQIALRGAAALDEAISSAMTARVKTCQEGHTVNQVMEIMTRGRFRHLPVEREGRLAGIVSIGDVVKQRIEDVEREADEIRHYIATA
ncbi:CBS domain-containing protein [Aliihoeflea sp. 40Bstr573]|uniref:CBS domain-containing protein n=1 Tax=Aliihoeflea sp. 40Bstr573 TaxID=2696467 RepID=UPI00209544E3|nr:CBS domain-containing protein [Aliihoeflea sp. 40Bstr573]MCO6385957.1 CBS domain-containing protein [Aliihoeflea sp. 40Bstr573]